MKPQSLLSDLLKRKGIGPQGSKSLSSADLLLLDDFLVDSEVCLVTKASIIMALLVLEPNEAEQIWINKTRCRLEIIPVEIRGLLGEASDKYQVILQKLIGLHHFDKSESKEAIDLMFVDGTPAYFKAAFLEGMRLKRETRVENLAFYSRMRENVIPQFCEAQTLVDIADSYDGNVRHYPLTLFVAPVLAACGISCLVHGVSSVAPKKGLTMHQILKAAGKRVDLSQLEAVAQLDEKSIGWAYLDQQQYDPIVYEMRQMREEMVKRPFLATFEKLLQPIRSKSSNILVTSYTHGHYKSEVIDLLKEVGECDIALNIKGIEGTSMPSLARETDLMILENNEIREEQFYVEGLRKDSPKRFDNVGAEEVLKTGIGALDNEDGYFRDQIIAQSTYIVKYTMKVSFEEAKTQVLRSIESGNALFAWTNQI